MDKAEIISKVTDALVAEFEVDAAAIEPTANMQEVLQLDSLSYVDLVALLDDEFGVKLGAAEVAGLKTFEDLYNCIAAKA